jgi:hypothetical protein
VRKIHSIDGRIRHSLMLEIYTNEGNRHGDCGVEDECVEYELSNHAAKRIQERKIEERWIEMTLAESDRDEQDPIDAQARHALKRIAEMDNRVLRVVYNRTTSPKRIISVYFDRGMKGRI